MRAVLTNFGTTGSVYPFISLAIELKRNGHDAAVALSPFFSEWVGRFGLEFIPIGPDLRNIQYDINEAMLDMPDSAEAIRDMFAPLMPALEKMFEELRDACIDADVLISGPWQPASPMVHELTGIPFVTVQNSHFGGSGTPAFREASASLINPFREHYGLPPMRDPLTTDANSPQLVLYNMSRHVRPPLPDWPPHYHMPGYLLLEDESWEPDPELKAFMEASEAPVVVTFGSMTHGDPEALADVVVSAIEQVRCRAVIQQGWSGLSKQTLPSNIYLADFAPHNWLFPRSSCIVHHGGAGTAAAVFRSGVPSVFVPHAFDHPLWAELAEGLGCAGLAIPFLELNARRLADAIKRILNGPHFYQAASALGDRVRAEQGLRKSRLLIEDLVRSAGFREHRAHSVNAQDEKLDEKFARRRLHQSRLRLRKGRAGNSGEPPGVLADQASD